MDLSTEFRKKLIFDSKNIPKSVLEHTLRLGKIIISFSNLRQKSYLCSTQAVIHLEVFGNNILQLQC